MSLNTNLFSAGVGVVAAGAYLYSALPASNKDLFYPVIRSVGVGVAAYTSSKVVLETGAWIRRQIILRSVQGPQAREIIARLFEAGISLRQETVDLLAANDQFVFALRYIINALDQTGVPLTQNMVDHLTDNVARIDEIIFAIIYLDQTDLLTQERFELILADDPARAIQRVALAIVCLERKGVILAPEIHALLAANAAHVWKISLEIKLLHQGGILPTREILIFLAAHTECDPWRITQGVSWLYYAHILTQKNLDALGAGQGARLQEVINRLPGHIEEPLRNQRVFDEIIREIEEREGSLVAEVLGTWNGEVPDRHKGDLRIPAEVIGDIAALVAHGSSAREGAIALAEQIERRIL